jgi:hypothetical protein
MATMPKALAILLCVGIIAEPMTGKTDEIYELCGPRSAGFIKVRNQKICLREDQVQIGSQQQTTVKAGGNSNVDDYLNNADLQLREGNKELACPWVSLAITASRGNTKDVTSESQKEQLKKYSARCNLRY